MALWNIKDIDVNHYDAITQFYIKAHNTTFATGKPNYLGARIPAPTHINIDAWNMYFHYYNYSDKALLQHIQYGFPVNYTAMDLPSVPLGNHASAARHSDTVDLFIQAELENGGCIGPFSNNPLKSTLILSPIQTVQKHSGIKRRTVLDLSFGYSSVNDGIPSEYCDYPFTLTYPRVDDLARLIVTKAQGTSKVLLYKTDLSRAYRQLFIEPKDINLMGYQWRGSIFIDVTYPFGIRSAAINCQRVTNAVSFIYKELHGGNLVNYLDDIASCATQEEASTCYENVLQLLKQLGLQSSPDKSQPPAVEMVFLGILINTETMTLSVPQSKIDRALKTIKQVKNSTTLDF